MANRLSNLNEINENPIYSIQVIHEQLPNFAKFNDLIYTFTPTKASDVGFFKVVGKFGNSEYNVFTNFTFTVEVRNEPPEFKGISKFLPQITVF